jgi:hypothetical protein
MIDEITCTFFKDGAETDVPRADVLAPFAAFVKDTEEISTLLAFPDGGEAELDIDDAMRIENFIVDAPPASPEFWSGLFQILKTLPAALYGEGAGIAVAQPTMAAHIGADMVEEFGAPKLVASAEELRALFAIDPAKA